ncbi:alpha/beta-hydrolase [Myriangium duriaei CBS 260.36]|uniref:Alpha/beta-hydrolase n=1 Tax=Myriangium duriaei CBS 260.36 TaxID=1168546 RepID=A0A9P4IS43_9PEZI|nr:alpha/beta-hydrolase [Myriangium duriaei CBS 260.36]
MADDIKFTNFDIVDTEYKNINGVAFKASIITPKHLKKGTRPVIVRWHGGALITGHRLFAGWFPNWTLELAQRLGAVIISPDYRLLPEATGLQILDDVKDIWIWLYKEGSLSGKLPEGVNVDLDHILLTGESAGGWIAIESILLEDVPKDKISVAVLQYAMLDVGGKHFNENHHKDLFDPPVPQLPRETLQRHLDSLKGDEVITEAMPPVRLDLALSVLQQGTVGSLIGTDRRIFPYKLLEERTEDLPPTWVYHGTDDNVVPIDGSEKFVKIVQRKFPDTSLHVSWPPGHHGFDAHDPAPEADDTWLKDGLDFVGRFWPGK